MDGAGFFLVVPSVRTMAMGRMIYRSPFQPLRLRDSVNVLLRPPSLKRKTRQLSNAHQDSPPRPRHTDISLHTFRTLRV